MDMKYLKFPKLNFCWRMLRTVGWIVNSFRT